MIEESARHRMESRASRLRVLGWATLLARLAGASGYTPPAPQPVAHQVPVRGVPAAAPPRARRPRPGDGGAALPPADRSAGRRPSYAIAARGAGAGSGDG